MSNTSPAQSQPLQGAKQAPRIWSTTLMFAITLAVAAVAVPWYGLTHGFSIGAWVLFVVFLYANGMSITGGYHRLWAHKSYDAHWSLRLVYLVFGTMALQNSVFIWASGHRTHHLNVDDVDKDPYSIRRGFWFAHIGWMIREYDSGQAEPHEYPRPEAGPHAGFRTSTTSCWRCWPISESRSSRAGSSATSGALSSSPASSAWSSATT